PQVAADATRGAAAATTSESEAKEVEGPSVAEDVESEEFGAHARMARVTLYFPDLESAKSAYRKDRSEFETRNNLLWAFLHRSCEGATAKSIVQQSVQGDGRDAWV
ncbi:unnamed protein product, partial [Phaeothamnion confervicola]